MGILLGWAIILLFKDLGIDGLKSLWDWNGIKGFYYWILQPGLPHLEGLENSINIFVLVLIVAAIWNFSRSRNEIQNALWWGTVVASVILLAEAGGFLSNLFPRRGAFWVHLERYSGTFKDPNSAGIFLSLLTPFVIHRILNRRWLDILFGLVVLSAGLVTGSRTFMIAVVIAILLMWPKNNSRKFIFGALCGLFLLVVAWSQLAPESYKNFSSHLPRSGERLALLFVSETGNESLEGRSLFIKIALSIWKDYPVFGVGPGSFSSLTAEYASELGKDLKGWSDNSNNFYTGVAAELGIVGLIGLLLSIVGIKFKNEIENPGRAALILLPILLISGPHFHFIEVAVLSGILIGLFTEPRIIGINIPFGFSKMQKLSSSAFFILVVVFANFPESGLFAVERVQGDEKSSYQRWSSVTAYWEQPCLNGLSELKFFSPNANRNRPIEINITPEDQDSELVVVKSPVSQSTKFTCQGVSLRIRISVTPPWMPGLVSNSKDRRILGVRIVE